MAKLVFKAADVLRIVTHSLNAPQQAQKWAGFDEKTNKSIMADVEAPAVILAKDSGIYLMSNGTPRDIVKGESGFVAYAEGFDPSENDDCYDDARNAVGGDDFGEALPWATTIKKMLDDGATHIVINFSARNLSLDARYPRGKGPKTETRPETIDEAVKRLCRVAKRKVVAYDPKKNGFVAFNVPPTDANLLRVAATHPAYKIVSLRSPDVVRKLVEQQRAA